MSIKPLVLLIGIWQGVRESESEKERHRLHNILSLLYMQLKYRSLSMELSLL